MGVCNVLCYNESLRPNFYKKFVSNRFLSFNDYDLDKIKTNSPSF